MPAALRVPRGQGLRLGRGVSDVVLPQQGIGPVHVRDDDRDVLEPTVIAAESAGIGRPGG